MCIMAGLPFKDRTCPPVVECLAPHLPGMSIERPSGRGFRLRDLLPAAAQLEQVEFIWSWYDFSLLGQFHMLMALHVNVEYSLQLTAPLPQLHTLTLRFHDTPLREANLQCLFPQAPALRQLVVEDYHRKAVPGWWQGPHALGRGDMEALVGLQCQQLDLLTVSTNAIDEHTVNLLARIQCPLKLSVDIQEWSLLGSAPLLTLLARLPNLVALRLISLPYASNALWDQRGACLPDVRRLEMIDLPLHMADSHLPLLSILSMCPALMHLTLHGYPKVEMAEQPDIYTCLWHAVISCAKLTSLKIGCLVEIFRMLAFPGNRAGYGPPMQLLSSLPIIFSRQQHVHRPFERTSKKVSGS